MNNDFKLLIFDWDGTLANSAQQIIFCLRAAIQELGLPMPEPEMLQQTVGRTIIDATHFLFPDLSYEKCLQVQVIYRYHFFKIEAYNAPLFPGVRQLLQDLQLAGYEMAIATSKGRKGLNKSLNVHQLESFFSITRTIDEAHAKPHPQMLLDILEFLNIESSQALMIGDSVYDLQMAKNANIAGVAVASGANSADLLLQEQPLKCLSEVKELSTWLTKVIPKGF